MPPRHARRSRTRRTGPTLSVLAAAFSLLAIAPRAARGQPPDSEGPEAERSGREKPAGDRQVRLTAPDCAVAPVALEAFLASLRVELAGSGLRCCEPGSPGGSAAPDEVRLVLIPCDPSANEVAVTIEDDARGGAAQRRVVLADVLPAARPRALALAVAELARGPGPTSSQERTAPPPPAAPNLAPPTIPPRPIALSPWAAGELRLHPGRDTTLWGGRLGVQAARDRWQVSLDLHGVTTRRRTDLGEIGVQLFGVGLAGGPAFSAGPIRLEAGPALEVGWVWVAGHTDRPDVQVGSGSGLTTMVGGRLGVEAPRASAIRLRIHLEGGLVLRGVTGETNGRPAAGTTGSYLLFNLGAAFLDRP